MYDQTLPVPAAYEEMAEQARPLGPMPVQAGPLSMDRAIRLAHAKGLLPSRGVIAQLMAHGKMAWE